MRLIKYTHACVRLESHGRTLLLDPGIWAEDAAFEGASDVLVTHEHADHVDTERLSRAASANPDLKVFAPAPIADTLNAAGVNTHTVESGDSFTAAGFKVRVVGGVHAEIFDGLPGCANVGYLIEGAVYHPGDSLFVPQGAIDTVLVPTSAPWLKLNEAIEFLRAVRPKRAYSIHDATLNDKGEQGVDRWLTLKGETTYGRIPIGESVTL